MFKTRYYINYRVINSQLIKLEGSLGWVFKSLTCCYEANLRPWSRSKYILTGTVSVISSDPLGKDNNTLKSFIWPSMNWLSLFLFLETVPFHLRFLCESDLSIVLIYMRITIQRLFRVTFLKTTVSFTFPIRLRFQGYHCHCCLESRLKLRLQSL